MKLFGEFEAVKFPQENLIFITQRRYLYYIYKIKYNRWKRYQHAGMDMITVENYDEVSREELRNAMNGKFPQDIMDFEHLCRPDELHWGDMVALLREDVPQYMEDDDIYNLVKGFLSESIIRYRSYEKIQALFEECKAQQLGLDQVKERIRELSLEVLGRDIYKEEIQIVDGHDGSSYFRIMPVRVIDDTDTDLMGNVAELKCAEISIEEDDVGQYLTPFLYKYFDEKLDANEKRGDALDFEWYLTYNYYTHDSIQKILNDINDTAEALESGRENEYTERVKEDARADAEMIADFYHRFVYRMEYMMKIGKENGCELISFMGP